MRKKILSLGFGVGICATSFWCVYAADYLDVVDYAISMTKAAGDYGKVTLSMPGWNTNTVRFLDYETSMMEGDFRRLVDNSWTKAQKWGTGFLLALETADQERRSKIYSGNVGIKERATSVFFDRLYTSYTLIRNSPEQQNFYEIATDARNDSVDDTTNGIYNPQTLIEYSSYTTSSGKVYTIRKDRNGRYRFSKSSKYGFGSMTTLQNYLEYQNRIIYQAPNGRMYGVFKQNGRFYFTRDEGSISTASRTSREDIESYINQHNQPLPTCPRAKEWRCL